MKAGLLPQLRIVVLAAGFSTRLGRPKALARLRGMSLLERTLRVLAPCRGAARIIVVVPPRAARYRLGARSAAAEFAANARRALGQASSVRCGLARARRASAVLLLPVDLPALRTVDIERLVRRWHGDRRRVVARRVASGAAAPLILPRWLFPRAFSIAGDTGLRDMVRRLPARCLSLVPLPSAEHDVDTPGDLERARRGRGHQPRAVCTKR
jgi:CTP:molybdopterin cytidylyltransferase MocA